MEYGVKADYALVKCETADRYGNLTYHATARNFGPIMCTAASISIVQAKRIVEPTQRLISYNSNRFKKNIFPSPNAPGGTVLVKGSESVTEQSKVMIDFIKRYHKTDYCDWNDMAVLTRFKIQLFDNVYEICLRTPYPRK
jgi:hypothetical protein